jgi:hypothetical protein
MPLAPAIPGVQQSRVDRLVDLILRRLLALKEEIDG